VRDQHDGLPAAVQVHQQVPYVLARGGVEGTGRLVGEQQRGPVDQRPGHRDPLTFAAGQPARVGAGVLLDAQHLHELHGAIRRFTPSGPGQLGRKLDVVRDGEIVEQIEELEHHADLLAAEPGQSVLGSLVDPLPGHGHGAFGRLVQARDEVQQRGLAAAGGTRHGKGLTLLDGERERSERGRADGVVALGHAVQLDHLGHRSPSFTVERALLVAGCSERRGGRPPGASAAAPTSGPPRG
jgi:hypothetical protein